MIVKRIDRDKRGSSFLELGKYMLNVTTKDDPLEWERTAAYILDSRNNGERLGGWRVTNCESEEPGLAIVEIMNTQALNTRSKADKTYHLVFSFPQGEVPTQEQLIDIENTLCAAIGFEKHQRISAIHVDTNNFHVHVAINKVHPVSYNNIEPFFDKRTLQKTAIELEAKHGLIATNHGSEAEQAVNSKVAEAEAHGGQQALLSWIKQEAADELKAANNWQDLHQRAAKYGLQVKKRGAGLVVGLSGKGKGIYVKASDLHRSLSLGALTKKWGEFETAAKNVEAVKVEKRYRAAPNQPHESGRDLFKQYQQLRESMLALRKSETQRVRSEHQKYADELKDWYAKKYDFIKKNRNMSREAKRRTYQELAAQRQADFSQRKEVEAQERKRIKESTPLPTWLEYLSERAGNGDELAIAVLRSKTKRQRYLATSIMRAENLDEVRHIVIAELTPKVQKNGDVRYFLKDGGSVLDTGVNIQIQTASIGASALALIMAAEKFRGQPLVVEGDKTFMRQVAQLAAMREFPVRFADPELEAIRENYAHAKTTVAAGSLSVDLNDFGAPGVQVEVSKPDIERLGVPLEDALSVDDAIAASLPTHRQALNGYVAARNRLRDKMSDIPYHKEWTDKDVGSFEYAGRRRLGSGGEAILLKRQGDILVKHVTPAQAAKASKTAIGASVSIDARGRFNDLRSRGRK